jgi:hypothetical protein
MGTSGGPQIHLQKEIKLSNKDEIKERLEHDILRDQGK